ncbi:MAG: hypothetical protein HDR12_15740 [Lachnospiraceae bacterium]|nr:hypothetical protein [Lachnospiraceae bacterium]
METKINKWIKIALFTLGMAALLVLSSLLGIRIERNRRENMELQKEHVSTIAVVNMDNGVIEENEQINYASQLISFPNDHFIVTGLTDARAGIENGTYAAYVVIPETFSESVTSIENDPRKVTLVYQYNNKLIEEAEVQAVNDINTFIALFNSNIAYMYMDAIMAELHRIQDDSSTILENDNNDMERLANVNAGDLIAEAEPVEEIEVINDIEPVELSTYTTRNYDLLDDMLLGYSEAVQTGKDDFANIQEENTGVQTATDNFFLTYETVIQDTAAGQSELLTTGRDSLAEAIGLYNQSVDDQETEVRNTIEDIINKQLEADKLSAETQLQEILKDIEDSGNAGSSDIGKLEDLQQQWETAYQNIQSEVDEQLTQKTEACCDSLEELINDVLTSEDEVDIEEFKTAVREQLSGISIEWDQLSTELPEIPETEGESGSGSEGSESGDNENAGGEENGETDPDDDPEDEYEIILEAFDDEEAVNNAVTDTLDLFKLEAESEQVNEVIQTCFVDALLAESERQMGILADEQLLLSQSMEDYETLLVDYDPMQYIEDADLGTYINDIGSNAGDMLGAVEQNNSDYMSYATEMYTNTTEHTNQVRSSLDEANEQTVENVEDCIDELISSRTEINSQSISILGEFPYALWYTRVGSQGNAEVYDCIVNPVVSQANGQAVANAAEPSPKKDNSIKNGLVIVLGIGIMFFFIEAVISLRQQHRESWEENEGKEAYKWEQKA